MFLSHRASFVIAFLALLVAFQSMISWKTAMMCLEKLRTTVDETKKADNLIQKTTDTSIQGGGNRQKDVVRFSTSARSCPVVPMEKLAPELHSKQEEDKTLLQWFNGLCNGTYIEMGALDGLRSSNTYVFNQVFHWRGVLIELSPPNYNKLVKNRPNEIATVHAAVCANKGTVHWYKSGATTTSGIWEFTAESYRKQWWKNATFNDTIPIECSPLRDVLEKHAPTHSFFDIFSLDVEGDELEVLQSLDFEKVGFGMIVVENDGHDARKDKAVTTLLEAKGYRYLQRLGNNDIMVNKEFDSIYKNLMFHDKGASVLNESSPTDSHIFLFDASTKSLRSVDMEDLSQYWKSNTTYGDLLKLSSPTNIRPRQALRLQGPRRNATNTRTIILSHAVPKTAGTTVRAAIFKHIRDTCPSAGDAANQSGAFSSISTMQSLMINCTTTTNYALAGHLTFPAINDDDLTFVHTVAFRNYEEWSRSALNQIVKWGGLDKCNVVRDHLSKCDDYRELSHHQYSKVQLERIHRQSLSRNDIVIVYDYKDTTLFQSQVRAQLKLPPLSLKNHNTQHSDEMCHPEVLEMFYKCHEL